MSHLGLQDLNIFMHEFKMVILVKMILTFQRHTFLTSSIPISKFRQGRTC